MTEILSKKKKKKNKTSVEKSVKSNFIISTESLNAYYSETQALFDINIQIPKLAVTAFIGPSGCGKSTLLRVFNRMNDYIDGFKTKGKVLVDDTDIYAKNIDTETLRKNVGMVFQKPNPFPKSIYENVAFGLKIQGINDKSFIEHRIEESLKQVALWGEVKDKMKKNAYGLSGGQQQRLCIARTLAVEPSVVLMDEPTSALDPISTGRIEELLFELRNNYSIVIVTHNMQQAARISDKTAFFWLGKIVEYNDTKKIFTNPKNKQTENYISGHFG